MTSYVVRTAISLQEPCPALESLIAGKSRVTMSELLPTPADIADVNDISQFHYELLFGDAQKATQQLEGYGFDVDSAYSRKPDVRKDALACMQAMQKHGVGSLEDWIEKNWGGSDLMVDILETEPFLVLQISAPRVLTQVAEHLMERFKVKNFVVNSKEVNLASNTTIKLGSEVTRLPDLMHEEAQASFSNAVIHA